MCENQFSLNIRTDRTLVSALFIALVHISVARAQVSQYHETLQLKDDEGSLGSPTFSPNGKKIAAARGSYQLTIWDSVTGKVLQQIDSGKSKEDGSLQSLT